MYLRGTAGESGRITPGPGQVLAFPFSDFFTSPPKKKNQGK
jgi:hypothetical protein